MRVPASVANLGPGLDCFGLALTLYLNLTAEEIGGTGSHLVELEGEGCDQLPSDGSRDRACRTMGGGKRL